MHTPIRHLVALIALIATLGLSQPAEAQTTITLTTPWPAQSRWQGELADAAKKIAARSDGRVAVVFTDDADADTDGGVMMGHALFTAIPTARVYSLPMQFADQAQADAARATLDPRVRADAATAGYSIQGIDSLGFMSFMSTAPIQSLPATQATTLWMPQNMADMDPVLDAFGLEKRLALPEKEVLAALKDGRVQTVLATPSLATAYQWHTRLSHAVDLPLIQSIAILAIETDALTPLSDADRELVAKTLSEQLTKTADALREYDDRRRARMARRKFDFATPSAAERAAWQAAADAAVAKQVEAGQIDAELVELLKSATAN